MKKVQTKYTKGAQYEIKMEGCTIKIGEETKCPSPYELLLASLGACTSMVIITYAKSKGWDVENVEIELNHEKIYAEDCENCETKSGRLDKIIKNIKITGNITEEQKQRLFQVAKACPVNKTLISENLIIDNLV